MAAVLAHPVFTSVPLGLETLAMSSSPGLRGRERARAGWQGGLAEFPALLPCLEQETDTQKLYPQQEKAHRPSLVCARPLV